MKKMVSLIAVALSIFMLGNLTGCGKQQPGSAQSTAEKKTEQKEGAQASEQKKLTFGVVYSIVHPFFDPCTKGAEDTAKKFNATVLIDAPKTGDVADQIRILEDMVTKKVDGLAICPTDAKAVEPIIKKALSMNIPVVTFGTDAPDSTRLSYIGTDQLTAAAHAAELLAKLINNKGEIIISQGLPTQLDQQQRVDGFKKELEKYPDIKVVDVQTGQGNPAKTLANIENMLQAHPNIAGIYGTDAAAGPAVTTVFKSKNKKIPVVVFDDLPEILQGVRDGAITATVVQKPYDWTVKAIEAIMDARSGKKLADPIYTDTYDVTKDNIDQLYDANNKLK